VAVWTSDALGLWTANWLQWNDAARWWANLVTWTLPSPDSALNVNATVAGDSGHITVDIPPGTSTASTVNQQVKVRIIAPNFSQETVTLQPTAPQRWEGNFPITYIGAYLLQVTWHGATSQLTTTTGMVVPYSPEYRTMGTDTRFLTLLARAGGGTLLGPNDGGKAFSANLAPVSAAVPLTFLLLTLAALLLPIDIATRRLASLEFLTIGFRWLIAWLRPRVALKGVQAGESAVSATALESLRSRREEKRMRAKNVRAETLNKEANGAAKTRQTRATMTTPAEKTETNQVDTSVASKLVEAKRMREKVKGRKEE
jgi:hypothetical protein